MVNCKRNYGKILTVFGIKFKFLTKSAGKQKMRNCELKRSKESATVTVRRPEAVKGAVKHTRLRLG